MKYAKHITDPTLSSMLVASPSCNSGCVDLECGRTNEVSQLSELSGKSLSTEEVDPTVFGIIVVMLWFGIK